MNISSKDFLNLEIKVTDQMAFQVGSIDCFVERRVESLLLWPSPNAKAAMQELVLLGRDLQIPIIYQVGEASSQYHTLVKESNKPCRPILIRSGAHKDPYILVRKNGLIFN